MNHLNLKPLNLGLLAAGCFGFSSAVWAEMVPEQLEPVYITATRSTENAAPVSSLESVDRAELNRRQAANMQQLVEDETGVAVVRDANRRGNAGVSIRGIDGNRVLYLIDGVRQPDRYQGGGGNAAISGGDYTEPESLARVEVMKGPASSLYGSDAVGGLLAYQTISPSDFVSRNDPTYLGLRTGWRGADSSVMGNLTFAHQGEQFSTLLQYVRRDGKETDNKGSNDANSPATAALRSKPNPQNWESDQWLMKFGFAPNAEHQFFLTYENFERQTDTDVINVRSMSPTMGSLLSQNAEDTQQRERLSLSHEWKKDESDSGFQALRWRVYMQNLEQQENIREARSARGAASMRLSDYRFEQSLLGLDAQLEHAFMALGAKNRLIYGVEWSRTESERLRDRTEVFANGSSTKNVAGEAFPHKTFPNNTTERLGLFAENRARWDSGWALTAGLRFDEYRLTLDHDDLSKKIAASSAAQDLKSSAFSPKLAISYDFTPKLTGFAQFSTGFRAPPFDDAALAFANVAHGYEVLPNANLKAEKSRGFELGLKQRDRDLSWQVTGFANQYTDFLERVLIGMRPMPGAGARPAAGGRPGAGARPLAIYQYQNLGKVKIWGAEASASWRFAPDWRVSGALSWAKGEHDGGAPYGGVDPVNGWLRLAYTPEPWGVDATLRFAAKKSDAPKAMDRRGNAEAAFESPSYAVLDLKAYWQVNKNTRIQAAVDNVLDKKYWHWSDVKGFAASTPALDFYSRPGRNVSVSLDHRFF